MDATEEAVPESQSTPNGTGLGIREPDGGQPTAAISLGPCRRWKRVPRRAPSSQGAAPTTASRASLQHLEAGVSVWVPQGIFGARKRPMIKFGIPPGGGKAPGRSGRSAVDSGRGHSVIACHASGIVPSGGCRSVRARSGAAHDRHAILWRGWRSAAARRTRMTPVSARPGHSVRCDRLLVRLQPRLVDLADGVQPPAD